MARAAAMGDSDTVTAKNQRVFIYYAAKLKEPNIHWEAFVTKLARWLDDDRAFYDTALSTILDLIETAYLTVRTIVGANDPSVPLDLRQLSVNNTEVKAYFGLVETLNRYRKHYVKPDLAAKLDYLVSTIREPTSPAMIHQGTANPSRLMQSASSSLANALHPSSGQAGKPTSSLGQKETNQSSSASAQPKKKKEIKLNLSAIIDKDMASQSRPPTAMQHPKMMPPVKIKEEPKDDIIDLTADDDDEPDKTTTAPPSKAVWEGDDEIMEISPPPSFRKTFPKKPKADSPQSLRLPQQSDQPSTASRPSVNDVDMQSPDRLQSESLSVDRSAKQSASVEQHSTVLPDDKSSSVDVPMPIEDTGRHDASDFTQLAVRRDTAADRDPTPAMSSTEDSRRLLDGNTVIDTDVVMDSVENNTVIAPVLSNSETPMDLTESGPVRSTADASITQDIPQHTPNEVDTLPEEIPLPIADGFGEEMKVLVSSNGFCAAIDKEESIHFDVSVTSEQFEALSRWNRRSENIHNSICISLGCYISADLEAAGHISSPNTSQLFNKVQSKWPSDKGLTLHTHFEGQGVCLPLSPPILTTNGLVDIAPFLTAGDNRITLRYRTDLTSYIFVLHAHHPTRPQLEPVVLQRKEEYEWKKWAAEAARPLELQPSKFVNAIV